MSCCVGNCRSALPEKRIIINFIAIENSLTMLPFIEVYSIFAICILRYLILISPVSRLHLSQT